MRFTTFTNKGTRENNTDTVSRIMFGNVCAFVVVDGGEFCGDISAPIIADAIKAELKADMRVNGAVVRNCFRAANAAIKQKAEEDSGFKNVKASGAVLITDGNKAVWGHIGNCRIYRLLRGKIREITSDHTCAYKDYLENKISFEDIAENDNSELMVSISADNEVDADVSNIKKLFFNYSFILCTDGFWKNLTGSEIEESITQSTKLSLCKMIDKIESHNITECDSVSAIVVNV